VFVARILFLAFVITAASLARAGEAKPNAKLDYVTSKVTKLTFAVPKASGLKPVKDDEDGIHFAGELRLSGTYVYGFESDYVSDSGEPSEPDLHFLPDQRSRALLPYVRGYGPIRGFHFSNPEAFIRAAIAPAAAKRVKQRNQTALRGRLTIWIDEYVATAECEGPVYTARFLRIERSPKLIANNAHAQPIGCI
jgi:hypothetical protein